MEETKKSKEGNVKLETFKSWGKVDVLGFNVEGNNVISVWCKLCSKHKDSILKNPFLKGKAKIDALNYTKLVTFVKKCNVERHLNGDAHKIAVTISKMFVQ